MSNAWEHLQTVRDMIGEGTAAHWSDRELLKMINVAQGRLSRVVAQAIGGWLIKSASVTPSSSVISWPADCAKIVYLEETTSGRPVPFSTNVIDRRVSRLAGTSLYSGVVEAYTQMRQIVVNQESYSNVCTLWYQIRVPDLHTGSAGAGGAASITLSAHDGAGTSGGFGARMIVDYYNNCGIQVVSGTGAGAPDTITDYTAARVATVTGTYAAASIYGTISRLPEECWDLMAVEAAVMAMAKPGSVVDPVVFGFMKDRWQEANGSFVEWLSIETVGTRRTRVTELD